MKMKTMNNSTKLIVKQLADNIIREKYLYEDIPNLVVEIVKELFSHFVVDLQILVINKLSERF